MPRRSKRSTNDGDGDQEPEQKQQGNSVSQVVRDRQRGMCCSKNVLKDTLSDFLF